jgi:O-antigen ligase/Tfp pilus assembly protein PilF
MKAAVRPSTLARLMIGVLTVAVPLAVWNGTPTAVGVKVLLVRVAVPVVAVLVLIDFVRRRCVVLPFLPAAVLALVLPAYVALLAWVRPHADFDAVVSLLLGLALFVSATALLDTNRRTDALLIAWQAGVIVVAAYFLFQRAGLDIVAWDSTGLIPAGSTFTNRNHLMYFLLASYPFGAYLTWRMKGPGRVVGAVSLALAVASIVAGGGRAALGVLAASLPFHALYARSRIEGRGPRRFLLVCALAVATGLGALAAGGGIAAARLGYREVSHFAENRLDIWGSGWRMAKAHMVFGSGPGTVPRLLAMYKTRITGVIFDQTRPLVHCHNEYLEMLAENGSAGLLLFVCLVGAAVWAGVRGSRGDGDGRQRLFFSLTALGGLLAHSMVTVAPRYIYCSMFFWLVLALCHNGSPAGNRCRSLGRAASAGLILLLVACAGASAWLIDQSQRDFRSDILLRRALLLAPKPLMRARALEELRRAVALKPDKVEAHYEMAYLYTLDQQLDSALFHYEQVEKTDPHFQNIHYNVGMIYYRKGNYQKAIEELLFALQMYSEFEPAMLHIAESYYYTWQFEECVKRCDRLLVFHPDNEKARILKAFVEQKIRERDRDERDSITAQSGQ